MGALARNYKAEMTDNSAGSDKAAENRRIFRPAEPTQLSPVVTKHILSAIGGRVRTFNSSKGLNFTCDFTDRVFNSFERDCTELHSIS